MTSSTAIFLRSDGSLSIDKINQRYVPQDSQSLVEVQYSAINPADIRHAFMGLHSYVAGYEWTGTVKEVGPSSKFTVGQRLFGFCMPEAGRPVHVGAHQDYLLAEEYMTRVVPEDFDPKLAVTIPVGVQTATDALFNVLGFGLPAAGISGRSAEGIPILIWGGASTVGWWGIQLAKAAGFSPILTTASPKNHETLKEIGADLCFDYRSPTVVEDIRQAVARSGKKLTTVHDAISAGLGVLEPPSEADPPDVNLSTPSLARRCCSSENSDELRLVSVLPVDHDPTWIFCLGVRPRGDKGWQGYQDPTWPDRIEKVMDWVTENHKSFLTVPTIPVVYGVEEAVKEMYRVFNGGASMEKVVVARPL